MVVVGQAMFNVLAVEVIVAPPFAVATMLKVNDLGVTNTDKSAASAVQTVKEASQEGARMSVDGSFASTILTDTIGQTELDVVSAGSTNWIPV